MIQDTMGWRLFVKEEIIFGQTHGRRCHLTNASLFLAWDYESRVQSWERDSCRDSSSLLLHFPILLMKYLIGIALTKLIVIGLHEINYEDVRTLSLSTAGR